VNDGEICKELRSLFTLYRLRTSEATNRGTSVITSIYANLRKTEAALKSCSRCHLRTQGRRGNLCGGSEPLIFGIFGQVEPEQTVWRQHPACG
jgi:hypothetical protein